MESSKPSLVECSPLDQIRQAEAEIIRQIAAAQQTAQEAVEQAQAQAVELKRRARKKGQREGQAKYHEIISRAEEEARTVVEQAYREAEILRRHGEVCMDDFVQRAVQIVIGHGQETHEIMTHER